MVNSSSQVNVIPLNDYEIHIFLRKIFHAAWKFYLLLECRIRTLSSPFACVVFFIRISFLYLLHFSRIPIVMYPN